MSHIEATATNGPKFAHTRLPPVISIPPAVVISIHREQQRQDRGNRADYDDKNDCNDQHGAARMMEAVICFELAGLLLIEFFRARPA